MSPDAYNWNHRHVSTYQSKTDFILPTVVYTNTNMEIMNKNTEHEAPPGMSEPAAPSGDYQCITPKSVRLSVPASRSTIVPIEH
jgi:hypothetical protein